MVPIVFYCNSIVKYCKSQSIAISIEKSQSIAKSIEKSQSIAKSIAKNESIAKGITMLSNYCKHYCNFFQALKNMKVL